MVCQSLLGMATAGHVATRYCILNNDVLFWDICHPWYLVHFPIIQKGAVGTKKEFEKLAPMWARSNNSHSISFRTQGLWVRKKGFRFGTHMGYTLKTHCPNLFAPRAMGASSDVRLTRRLACTDDCISYICVQEMYQTLLDKL